MKRRTFLRAGLSTALSLSPGLGAHREETNKAAPSATETPVKPFEFEETTIADLQEAMRAGRHTSRTITEAYLERIREVDKEDPALNSVIELNPDALAIAENLDNERKAGRIRGPFHGIPILIKDNINTGDRMQTTGGLLFLDGQPAPLMTLTPLDLSESGLVFLG